MNQMKSTIPMQMAKPMMREALAAEAVAPLPPISPGTAENPRWFSPRPSGRCSACRPYFYDGGLMPKHFYPRTNARARGSAPCRYCGPATMIMYGAELGRSPSHANDARH